MATHTFESLATTPKGKLLPIFQQGVAPDVAKLAGWEFRGVNVLYPHEKFIMWVLQNVRFIKCFFEAPDDHPGHDGGRVIGYNLKVERGGLDQPWTCTPNDDKPDRIGNYHVYPKRIHKRPDEHPNAAFLDYAVEGNNLFTGSTLEDYVVHPDPDNEDLLLGCAYFNLGPIRTRNFFVAERLQKHER